MRESGYDVGREGGKVREKEREKEKTRKKKPHDRSAKGARKQRRGW